MKLIASVTQTLEINEFSRQNTQHSGFSDGNTMSSDSTTTISLQNFLPYRLFVLASRISSSLAQHYEDQYQVSRAQWRVLAVLGEKETLSAAEVAQMTAMDKVAVSRAVSKLLDTGHLQRSFSPQDRRRSALRMTNSGRKLYEKIVPIALEHERKILDQLSETEIELLRGMLRKLDDLSFDF